MADEVAPDGGSEKIGEYVRIYRRGENWYANYQFNKRQYRESLGTTNKKEARRRAAQIEVKITAGEFKPAVVATAVREAVTAYLQMVKTEERARKTQGAYKRILEQMADLAESSKITDISGLGLAFLDMYRRLRSEGKIGRKKACKKTIYNESVVIRQLIHFAISRNMLAADPMKGLKMPKPKPTKQPCWTAEEVARILAAAPLDLAPALTLLAETGMRFGELAWLTWADVDLERNLLFIRPKDGWKPKTGDQRAVPLSQLARRTLDSLPRTYRWVTTMPASAMHRQAGRQWTERRLLQSLKRVLKQVDLVGKLHTFRHSFISHALISGTPVAVVKEWVGHVDPHVIDLYTHIHDHASQAAMQRLSSASPTSASKESDNEKPEGNPAQIQHKAETAKVAEAESAA